MLTVMTIGSSWVGSMALKASSVKVMGGILGIGVIEAEFTDCMARRCPFHPEIELKRKTADNCVDHLLCIVA